MTDSIENFKAQAGALNTSQRAELAFFLITSLEPEEEGVEDAWRAEIDRRVAEIRGGAAVGRPVVDVIAELRERHP